MFEHKKLQNLDDYFIELKSRRESGIYFYRLNQCDDTVREFITRFYEAAGKCGVIIEGRIPNPDENNLAYYEEIMGLDFQMSMGFFTSSLRKWLPRMNDTQRGDIAGSMYDTLDSMRKSGKNDNILKNAYIKFMCWLYYKFERILGQMGNVQIPKILYEGTVSNYELRMLQILGMAGCDIVLLQYQGDESYLKLDPQSLISDAYQSGSGTPFPDDFSIRNMRQEMEERRREEQMYGTLPKIRNCTNAWISENVLEDLRTPCNARGSEEGFFYNCFIRMEGVEDKLTYLNDLFQFQLQLEKENRHILVVENAIKPPDMDEIGGVRRGSYQTVEQMLRDLSSNIQYPASPDLQKLMVKNFLDVMLQESHNPQMNLNKLMNKAVYLICWLKRYQSKLFGTWKFPEIGCFILLGGCKTEAEVLFLKVLSGLPCDVLILVPDLNRSCVLEDKMLFVKKYSNSMNVTHFPREGAEIQMGTAAYHAERELDTLMYQDSGIYRNQQYERANAVTLRTMYEEITLLWDQETKYRPNFSVVEDVVNMPVIFSKISGVKDGNVNQYWQDIKKLNTEDTFLICKTPFIDPLEPNPMRSHMTEFLKNGKVQKAKIKAFPDFPYTFLRDEMQDYILDKVQLLIDQRTIRGTFENGCEYTIMNIALNLNKILVRMIQKFDFTKKNPKLIWVLTTESILSLEDSIMTAFLNLIGFDIVFFVPTGYQNIEKHFNKIMMEEHQIGEYLYDLHIPDLSNASSGQHQSWRDKLFRRG